MAPLEIKNLKGLKILEIKLEDGMDVTINSAKTL